MKLKLFLINAFVFGFLPLAKAQTDSARMANEIIKIEQALADVLPVDSVFWGKHLDPKWHIVDEDGNISSRQEFLASFKPWPKEISISAKVTHPILTFYKDIAVIYYIADEHETAYGQNIHTTYATMDVWYKKGDSWMMLGMQNFEIPALPPVAKIDARTLQQYVGTYELIEGKTAVVTVRNDTLFVRKSNGKTEALLPETENVFFRKSDARGRKIFLKDGTGNWAILERRNGQDLVWKRKAN